MSFYVKKSNLIRKLSAKKNVKIVIYFIIRKQYMSEKIGGAEKTKLDEEFVEMERVSYLLRNLCWALPVMNTVGV